ncbi:MAG: hypothetical protein WC347_00655 [Smithellaceae bacterium]|jgi:hypothetical protein
MEFLAEVYLGNTLQNWLIALCILVGVFAVLKVIQRIVISRLSKLAEATDNRIDDLIVSMLRQTKFLILLLASAYVASQAIILKPAIAALWQIVSEIIEKQENARLDRVHFKEYGDSSLNFEVFSILCQSGQYTSGLQFQRFCVIKLHNRCLVNQWLIFWRHPKHFVVYR